MITLPLYFLCNLCRQAEPTRQSITQSSITDLWASPSLSKWFFLAIGRDPQRYRMMVIPSILEKLSYVLANLALFLTHDISTTQALPSSTDLVLAILFITAWTKTRSTPEQLTVVIIAIPRCRSDWRFAVTFR